MKLAIPFALLLFLAACATPYSYRFQVTDPGVVLGQSPRGDVVEDADVKAEVTVVETRSSNGAEASHELRLRLGNKTDDVMQVRWTEVLLVDPNGASRSVRPDQDLGGFKPGESQGNQLIPFVVPAHGAAALAYDGKIFELQVPIIVRKQRKQYGFHFMAHVSKAD
jgi:hypothetical protein